MRRLLLVLLLACGLAPSARALHVEDGEARYATSEDGYSRAYQVEITFLSGDELNQKMISFSYSPLQQYAVFFWGDGIAAIVSLGPLSGCGLVFTPECLSINRNQLRGRDQDGRFWQICTRFTC